jgi:phosphohistidine phosphatase
MAPLTEVGRLRETIYGRGNVKLYVMRHGPAEDPTASLNDFDRALTGPGRERVRRVVGELARRGELPRAIISSPLVRALQTAEIVAQAGQIEQPVAVRREIAPGGDLRGLVREFAIAGARRVMLVGHEPDVSELVYGLAPAALEGGFDKAMVVGLRISGEDRAERRFVLEPRTLVWR